MWSWPLWAGTDRAGRICAALSSLDASRELASLAASATPHLVARVRYERGHRGDAVPERGGDAKARNGRTKQHEEFYHELAPSLAGLLGIEMVNANTSAKLVIFAYSRTIWTVALFQTRDTAIQARRDAGLTGSATARVAGGGFFTGGYPSPQDNTGVVWCACRNTPQARSQGRRCRIKLNFRAFAKIQATELVEKHGLHSRRSLFAG
ncbi:hypothetical protein BD309DRAFT_983596 [Dichomitus squalens]|nr:hypothetical protein BD309DRAFT_983596 [Dichomitus squalens]